MIKLHNNYSILNGIESGHSFCMRITTNWKCHFNCNFCYVPQILQKRKKDLNKLPSKTLNKNIFNQYLNLLSNYYKKIDQLSNHKCKIYIPFSFCASDPLRDIDEQIELIEKAVQYNIKTYNLSREQAEFETGATIIIDLHNNFDKYLELLKKLKKKFKNVFIHIASTVWIHNGVLLDSEIELHKEAQNIAYKLGYGFFSIVTPSADSEKYVYSYEHYIPIAKKIFDLINRSYQYMLTINVPIILYDNYKGFTTKDFYYIQGRTFINFYEAYFRILLSAYINYLNINTNFNPLNNIINVKSINFKKYIYPKHTHYLVCEVGLIPGLANFNKNQLKNINPHSFGCFPAIGCFNSITGIEPDGIINACQLGHDPLEKTCLEIKDFIKDIIYSKQRIRNLRKKIQYPFKEKYCFYKNNECTKNSCSTFIRGSCPVDLYFNNKDYLYPAYSCSLLTEICNIQINLIRKLKIHPVEFSKKILEQSEYDYHNKIIPILINNREKSYYKYNKIT